MKIHSHIRMAKSRKLLRRKGKKALKHSGGAQGSGIEPGGALNPGLANGLMVHRSYDSCMSSSRPGQISYSATGGLPGTSGLLGMRGGAYTNNLSQNYNGFAQIDKLNCTPNHVSPLNQRGGVGLAAAKDMGVYEAPSARYTTEPSQFTNSVGAPILLNRPLDTTAWSKACTQTAGSRRKKGRHTKKANRKVSRKRYSGGGPEMTKAAAKDELANAEADLKMLMGKYEQALQLAATAAEDEAVSRAGRGTFLEDMIISARRAREAVEFIKQAIMQTEARIAQLQERIDANTK